MSVGAVTQSQATVVNAIARAATRTGADFDYLLRTATRESGLKNQLKSNTSSAAGPFQFIEQTWLSMMQRHGGEYGYGAYADAIEEGEGGRYRIADESMRAEILALRHDPRAAALMAGEMTQEATNGLERALGRPVRENEAYVAHFMGLGGATRLIRAVDQNASTIAADLFPRAANANRPIFYNDDGSAKTVAQVYENLTTLPEVDGGAVAPVAEPARASGPRPAASVRAAAFHASAPGSYTLMLTPDVIEILSSLNPAAAFGDDDKEDRSNRFAGV